MAALETQMARPLAPATSNYIERPGQVPATPNRPNVNFYTQARAPRSTGPEELQGYHGGAGTGSILLNPSEIEDSGEWPMNSTMDVATTVTPPNMASKMSPIELDRAMIRAGQRLASISSKHWLSDLNDFKQIQVSPWINHGRPTIEGTRLPVYSVISYFAEGLTKEDLLNDFPGVEESAIDEAIQYTIKLLGG